MARTTIGFQLGDTQPAPARQRHAEKSLRLVVIGDLTGRGSRGIHEPETLAARRITPVDIDNFDEVLSRLAPEVHVPLSAGGDGAAITIRSLDDFRPEALFNRLDVFASLRGSRRRLLDPARFAEEAARLRPSSESSSETERPATKASTVQPPSEPRASGADVLNQILSQPPSGSEVAALAPAAPVPTIKIAGVDLARLVDEVVAPYIRPKADPRQAEFVAAVDAAAAELMRRLLHARAYQALESAWVQLWRITKAVTGESEVRLFLLDATRAEFAADFAVHGTDIGSSRSYRLLVDQQANLSGGEPWGALVVLEAFGRSAADCSLLASLGTLARAAGGPVLADAAPDVVGLTSWTEAAMADDWRLDDGDAERRWANLRTSPAATSVGLSAPRPLVRLPYGRLNSVSGLAFDELGDSPSAEKRHASFLWGSAALACAELIGRAILREGWSPRPGQGTDLDDLPAYVYEQDGEMLLLPSAEVFLTVGTGELLAERGVIPLLSYANRHAARCPFLGSLADPSTPLFP